ncbi:MAG TPA: hypothetical protein VE988_28915, partial [Gemmataceae bacterium]|nr:hypothetical protein [Gemmataceae bacterium]
MAATQIAEKATTHQGSQSMWWTALGFHLPYMLMAGFVNAPVVWPAIFLAATGVVVSVLLFAVI